MNHVEVLFGTEVVRGFPVVYCRDNGDVGYALEDDFGLMHVYINDEHLLLPPSEIVCKRIV